MDETSHPPTGPDGPPPPQPSDPFQQTPHGPPPPGAVPAYVVARPPTNGWKIATFVLGGLLALATLVIVGLVAWILFCWFGGGYVAYGGEYDEYDEGAFSVSDTSLEAPCDRFADLARDVPLFVDASEAAGSVAAIGTAAHDLADAARVSDLDDGFWDPDDWADGWDALGDALEDFSTRLADDPDARLEIPLWSSGPATVTLGYEGPEGCEIPAVVSALDPDTADQLYPEIW